MMAPKNGPTTTNTLVSIVKQLDVLEQLTYTNTTTTGPL